MEAGVIFRKSLKSTWVCVLVQGVFVLAHGVFVLVQGVFVLVERVLGLKS